ncbi:MAG: HlyD family type I secretion periplasmic adaptor subunit, partial [Deltaproteobacteria bacterium]|nr:HlyD family type I secretion periplasmic adaptor subunit [Deltaproteobacteria bacterium]
MSTSVVTPAKVVAAPAPTSLPVPRAGIDYGFESVFTAPPRQRVTLWLMVGLIAMSAVALAVARVDVIISANGKLATSDSQVVVQPLETSIVRSIEVKVGQNVKKGDVLATLDPTFTQADESELVTKSRSLQAAYDRLTSEMQGAPYAPAQPNSDELTQLDIWRKRQAEYSAHVKSAARKVQEFEADLAAHKTEADGLAEQIRLAGDAQGIYSTLVASNLASKLKLIETSEHLVQTKSRLATNVGEQQRLTKQIAETEADRDAFVSEWGRKLGEELAKTRSDRDAAAAQLSKAQLRHRMAVLRAPRDATVLEVADRPEGSVVREAEPLLRMVPADAPIVADIRVDTRDVARLHVGDPVTVKFEALPWQQFGLAHGILRNLGPDTLADENPREAAEDMTNPALRSSARESATHYRAR